MGRIKVVETSEAMAAGPRPLTIRSRAFTAIVLAPPTRDVEAFLAALDARLRQAPNFFRDCPVVLDLREIAKSRRQFDLAGLVAELRHRAVLAVGVQNVTDWLLAQSHALGLPVLRGGREAPAVGERSGEADESVRPDRTAAAAEDPVPAPAAMFVSTPVRSGQQVFADQGDLIVTAAVSPGAELIARGNIHCYGPMRGRAIAGVDGNTAARVFFRSLEAELIAIAGLYKLSDDFDPAFCRRPVQAFLQDDALLFGSLA